MTSRRRDALDAAVRDVVVRHRLAAELKVWRDGFCGVFLYYVAFASMALSCPPVGVCLILVGER